MPRLALPFIDFKEVGERLRKEVVKLSKKEKIELRKKYKITDQLWSNVVGEGDYERDPSLEFTVLMANILNLSLDYLLYNKQDINEHENFVKIPNIETYLTNDNDLIYINNLKICCFSLKCLLKLCKNPSQLICMFVEGNSMAPQLINKDCVIVDLLQKNIQDFQLFLFNFVGLNKLLIRRFSYQNSKISVISDNKLIDKPSYVMEKDINIIGKVILSIRNYV